MSEKKFCEVNAEVQAYSWIDGVMLTADTYTVGIADGTPSRMYLDMQLPALPRNPQIARAELTLTQSGGSILENSPKLGFFQVTETLQAGETDPACAVYPMDIALMKTCVEGETVTYTLDITQLAASVFYGETEVCAVAVKLLDENLDENHTAVISRAEVKVYYDDTYAVDTSVRAHTHDLGCFGQGAVDLLCGNLLLDCEDLAGGGSRSPVTIKHLYNSALAGQQVTANTDIGLHTADFTHMKPGLGWRLNIMQSMVAANFCCEGTAYKGFIYTDESGKQVRFKLDGTTHVDMESGEMRYDAKARTLTRGNDRYIFDTAGRLIQIIDQHSNELNICYDVFEKISHVVDGTGRIYRFAYSSGRLSQIFNPKNYIVSAFQYAGDLLTAVIRPGVGKTMISYTDGRPCQVEVQTESGTPVYKVVYTFSGDRVSSVTEYGVENGEYVEGVCNAYAYKAAACRTSITTSRQADSSEDAVQTVYTFDRQGEIVKDYVQGSNAGTDNGTGQISTNYLSNHGFETKAVWSALPANSSTFSCGSMICDGENAKFGKGYYHMLSQDAECTGNGVRQIVCPVAGEYTLSSYVRVISDFSGGEKPGAYIRVTDLGGRVLGESEHLQNKCGEYVRLQVPVTLGLDMQLHTQLLVDGAGEVYFDAVQLEKNPCANPYNMLENGDFEQANQRWTVTEGTAATTDAYFNGAYAMGMAGSLERKSNAMQTVFVRTAQTERETFTLSGWAKGYALENRTREGIETPAFRLRAELHYDDGQSESFTADFSPCTEQWQYASVQFCKSRFCKVSSLKVYCDYDHNLGMAYFDDIQLIRNSLESGLTAEDFVTEEAEEVQTAQEEAPGFEELMDAYGNALTETTFSDGEFGSIYRSVGYNTTGNDLITETDARGYVTTYTVDQYTSRNTGVTDRCGNQTAYTYDLAGRTTKVTAKDAQEIALAQVSYAYDPFDNLSAITRGDGLGYLLAYDPFHNLSTIGIDGKAEPLVTYGYRPGNGRLKQITYANGDTMKATYNSLGQLTAEKWYDSENSLKAYYKYAYDGQGNLVRSIDILGCNEYSYTYEEGVLVRAAQSTVTLSGEMVTGKTLVCQVFYSYTEDGSLKRKRIVFADGTERVILCENPEEGDQVVQLPAGDKTVTSRSKTDSFGRKVFDELQLGTGFVSRQFAYYAGQITDAHQENGKVKSAATTQLVSQIVLSDGRTISYEYDPEERITKVTDSIEGVTEYTYDALGQLLTETVNGEVVNEMVYDNYGNILQKNGKAYTYGDSVWRDKLTAFDGQQITYDAQGNPVTYLGHTLTWEKGRQLKSFDGITYAYNANGIRTAKTVNGVTHEYLLDGTNILREAWGENVLIPLYDNQEQVCGIEYNGSAYFFLKNLQGDVIAITDADGETVVRYSYDAWGVCTIAADTSETGIASINPYRYRSYYFDSETALYYLQSRYYDPATGRFINGDEPKCFSTDMRCIACNIFTYCENDAVNLKDITGGLSWSVFPALLNFLSGIASKLGNFLLSAYGVSKKKYAHKLKYKNASSLTKFVNDNKRNLKKFTKGFSKISNCLEILAIGSECYDRIKKHSGKSLLKTVASLAFYGIVSIIGELVSKLVSWIISKLIAALCWARFLIELILDTLIDWVLGRPWVSKLENKFVQSVNSNKMNIGNYIIALFKAAKAAFA